MALNPVPWSAAAGGLVGGFVGWVASAAMSPNPDDPGVPEHRRTESALIGGIVSTLGAIIGATVAATIASPKPAVVATPQLP